jgi:hypothetical protein
VRGNIWSGQPNSPDSFNLRYLDDFETEEHPVNQTLHGGARPVCAEGWGDKFWKGPIVAYLKASNDFDAKAIADMHLPAYCNAIDYFAYFRGTIGSMIGSPGSGDKLSKHVMEQRSGKVKGVRINCLSDQAGNSARQLVSVDVPREHPLFILEVRRPLGNRAEFR